MLRSTIPPRIGQERDSRCVALDPNFCGAQHSRVESLIDCSENLDKQGPLPFLPKWSTFQLPQKSGDAQAELSMIGNVI